MVILDLVLEFFFRDNWPAHTFSLECEGKLSNFRRVGEDAFCDVLPFYFFRGFLLDRRAIQQSGV